MDSTPDPPMTTPPNVRRGIGLILVAALGIVAKNTGTKVSGLADGQMQLVFHRGVMGQGLLVPSRLLTRLRAMLRPRRIGGHLVRMVIGNLGWGYCFLGLHPAVRQNLDKFGVGRIFQRVS